MKDGSQGYDVPFSVCEHGSLKRSCSVCIYQAELHEAREQLNIAVRALERAKRSIFINSLNVTHDIISSALDQINGKGE